MLIKDDDSLWSIRRRMMDIYRATLKKHKHPFVYWVIVFLLLLIVGLQLGILSRRQPRRQEEAICDLSRFSSNGQVTTERTRECGGQVKRDNPVNLLRPPMPMEQMDSGWESIQHSAALDMREFPGHYLVCFSLPNVKPKEIHVYLRGQVLEVTTFKEGDERSTYEMIGKSGRGVNLKVATYRHGIQGFRRRIQLPGLVSETPAPSAHVTNGVLRITLPKAKLNENVVHDYRIM